MGDMPLSLPSNTLLFRAEGPQVGVVEADGTVQFAIGRSLDAIRDNSWRFLAGVEATAA